MQAPDKAILSDDVRKQNRFRILRAFRQTPSLSRTQLAEITGLSPGTISNITTQLLADGILRIAEPDSAPDTRQGRPRVQLMLNAGHATIVSGSLTYGRLTLRLADYAGDKIASATQDFDTEGKTAQQVADGISALIRQTSGGRQADILCFGVQGTTAKDNSGVLWSPILSEDGCAFATALAKKTGAPVLVENDCALITRAIDRRKGGQVPTFGAVLMSYGIGMGLYVNGTLFSGQQSSATEFGHLPYRPGGAQCRCGKKGCIEAYASDYAIWRAATGMDQSLLPRSPVSPDMIRSVIDRAAAGDGPERAALLEASRALGIGLATLFALFDPFPVVFIGPGSALVSVMEEELRSTLRENFRFKQRPHLTFQTEADEITLTEQGAGIAALDRLDRIVAYGS